MDGFIIAGGYVTSGPPTGTDRLLLNPPERPDTAFLEKKLS
jgi:hypothetical protein